MATDPRKRQRQLEKKKAKRVEKRAEVAASGRMVKVPVTAPILDCVAENSLFSEHGIGAVILTRRAPDGSIAFASFLVDMFCLGVKDAYYTKMPEPAYRERMERYLEADRTSPMEPACARKLVEGAVAYAADLGLSPHSDYRVARQMFGDIDAAECSREFTYGKDGKPFFMPGPHMKPAQVRRVMKILMERMGPNNFDFLLSGNEDFFP